MRVTCVDLVYPAGCKQLEQYRLFSLSEYDSNSNALNQKFE